MDYEIWHLWVIAGILLFIVEVFTTGFLAACLAVGCLAAASAAFIDTGLNGQILAFSAGSLITFFTVRPFMLRVAHQKKDNVRTNVEALIGKKGRVTESINPITGEGRVQVYGDNWKAEWFQDDEGVSDIIDGQTEIPAGSSVEVVAVDSATLQVKPVSGSA